MGVESATMFKKNIIDSSAVIDKEILSPEVGGRQKTNSDKPTAHKPKTTHSKHGGNSRKLGSISWLKLPHSIVFSRIFVILCNIYIFWNSKNYVFVIVINLN